MFGEYGIYAEGIFFGVICDNKLSIKPTQSGRAFIGEGWKHQPIPVPNRAF